MNPAAKNIRKTFDLASLSTLTIEDIAVLDALACDGRANVLDEKPERPGGLNYYSLRGVRYFEQDVQVALGGMIGGKDQDNVQEAVAHLAAHDYMLPIAGKRTNRSQVFLGPGGQRFIIRRRREVSFEHDLQRHHERKCKGMISRSRACVLGNIPPAFTEGLIDFGSNVGTYMTLVAGERQFSVVPELAPHALIVNAAEAKQITGAAEAEGEELFGRLLETTKALHLVVMTGGGTRPIYVEERIGGERWSVNPVHIGDFSGLFTLGAGDVFAGVLSLLLGRPRCLLTGLAVREAVRFAQEVAVAHVAGDPYYQRRLRTRYAGIRHLFEPGKEEQVRQREAA